MSHRQVLQALTGLLAGLFTAILSSTIVANALPTIMSELNGSQTDFAWVITAALLANAATTPIWGKFADLFDKKLLVQISIVIFVAGSVLAGFAENIPLLLTARVIQGAAMGGLTALAQAIIGTIIAPRERGRYAGYMGGVMAVATAGGPLLGGFIVDSPLGWRWTFFVCVPFAIIALVLLQITLKLPDTRRRARIDWLGSILLTAGVSLLLIWVSFAGKEGYYAWLSGESALMVGGSVVLLALLLVVEARVPEPIIPLKIVSQRTTALAIIASVAVGIAMFASSSYIGQYYQVARGATPTEAGLLTLPMIAGNLIGSIGAGQLVTRYGKWKRYLIAGSVFLIVGLGLAGTIDHLTDLWLVGTYTFVFGLGLGLMLQNLVLAVQNTVAVRDIGSASASVAFFRSLGGAAGVAVLGAILATQVSNRTADGLAAAGVPAGPGGAAGGSLDLVDLPAPVAEIVRSAYGDSTATIFIITAGIAVIALVCVLFIKETPLRRTVDIVQPAPASPASSIASTAPGAMPSTDGSTARAGRTPAGDPAGQHEGEADVVAVRPSHGRRSAGPLTITRDDVERVKSELAELDASSADHAQAQAPRQ
ncbi:MFS transporter [Arthrobacter echini]|uniref:MFS transporter n=1 Tax=Arthrobacter echini TaxID=1529066 RepID=A0A4S5E5N5_9MICC|nr:MFS transporter [Arthrobacter echini]THJ66855.1 MFS transporter [Arthrobacter echini]